MYCFLPIIVVNLSIINFQGNVKGGGGRRPGTMDKEGAFPMTPQSRRPGRSRLWASLAVAAGVFLWMLLLYTITPYTSDDYRYHYMYDGYLPDGVVRPLTSVADIPESMYNHYFLWGGRVVAHGILQFFMLFDKWVFNLCSAGMFVLLGVLICLHARPRLSSLRPVPLLASCLGLWLLLPQFDLSVMWMSGAFNYLWMACLILGVLLPFRCWRGSRYTPDSAALRALVMAPLGFLMGWTNENSGGAAILLVLFYMGCWLLRYRRIPLWSVTALLASLPAFYLLISAPGNSGRDDTSLTDLSVLLSRVEKVAGLCLSCLLVPGLIVLAVVVLSRLRPRKGTPYGWQPYLLPALYILAGLASVVALVVSPTIGARSWTWAVCFFLIAAGMTARLVDWHSLLPRRLLACAMAVACVASVAAGAQALPDIWRTHQEVEHQLEQIRQQKAAGVLDVVVDPITPTQNRYNAFVITAYLTDDPERWFNRWMAEYYGLDSIVLAYDPQQEGSDAP